jgi:hypothetical protein
MGGSWASFCRTVVEDSNEDSDLELLGLVVLGEMEK